MRKEIHIADDEVAILTVAGLDYRICADEDGGIYVSAWAVDEATHRSGNLSAEPGDGGGNSLRLSAPLQPALKPQPLSRRATARWLATHGGA